MALPRGDRRCEGEPLAADPRHVHQVRLPVSATFYPAAHRPRGVLATSEGARRHSRRRSPGCRWLCRKRPPWGRMPLNRAAVASGAVGAAARLVGRGGAAEGTVACVVVGPSWPGPVDGPPVGNEAGCSPGQPVRALSMIGAAARSTAPMDVATAPSPEARSVWFGKSVTVLARAVVACRSAATCGPRAACAASVSSLAAVPMFCSATCTPSSSMPTAASLKPPSSLRAVWNSVAASQRSAPEFGVVGAGAVVVAGLLAHPARPSTSATTTTGNSCVPTRASRCGRSLLRGRPHRLRGLARYGRRRRIDRRGGSGGGATGRAIHRPQRAASWTTDGPSISGRLHAGHVAFLGRADTVTPASGE